MSQTLSEDDVKETLQSINYPGLNRDVLSFGFVKDTEVEDGAVTITFDPSTDRDDVIQQMVDEMKEKLSDLDQVESVTVDVQTESESDSSDTSDGGVTPGPDSATPPGESSNGSDGSGKVAAAAPGAVTSPDSGPMDQEPIQGVDHIVAVASGKGGVGKSTVAVNLAAALAEQGMKVGLGDMDIYGPSAPTMLGINERPTITEDELIRPPETDNIRAMSIGFIMNETEPVVWRGPMVMKAVTQFLRDVEWGDLDYLVLDLPPGTGDAQLTLMQKVPLSGSIIVTTPQDVALIDAQKSVEMFRKLDAEILGIVENMSVYVCPECGNESHIFGSGGGRKEALRLNVPFLGGIPLEPRIREGGDEGTPIISEAPDSKATEVFLEMAEETRESAVPTETVMERLQEESD
jgi:ATP-binding protein involved in chromosome partitioning